MDNFEYSFDSAHANAQALMAEDFFGVKSRKAVRLAMMMDGKLHKVSGNGGYRTSQRIQSVI
jgi:hypothetical protein